MYTFNVNAGSSRQVERGKSRGRPAFFFFFFFGERMIVVDDVFKVTCNVLFSNFGRCTSAVCRFFCTTVACVAVEKCS